jgi:putative Ca2+/H+ antiporter (TMEM165/GDT1 family)
MSFFNAPWDPRLFVSTFSLIFIAELPDKTAFATLLMATRKNPFAIFIGVAAAFVIQSFVAVSFGSLLSLLPHSIVRIAAGLMFFVFAWMMWRRKDEKEEDVADDGKNAFLKTIWSSFIVIFVAEWGDLTQLATATLSAQYRNPLTLFTSATLALWTVTAIAVLVGNRAKHMIKPGPLNKIASVAFVLVGLYMLADAFLGR